jgi:hypothetical protein
MAGLTFNVNPTEAPITGIMSDNTISPYIAYRIGYKF